MNDNKKVMSFKLSCNNVTVESIQFILSLIFLLMFKVLHETYKTV